MAVKKISKTLKLDNGIKISQTPKKMAVLPLRDVVIYPNMIFPVLIGRPSSLKAVAQAVEKDKYIFVVAQKNSTVDEPKGEDLYVDGAVAKIIQLLRLPNNLIKVLVEGLFQAKAKKYTNGSEWIEAEVEAFQTEYDVNDKEFQATINYASTQFSDYVKKNKVLPPDVWSAFESFDDPVRKLYYAAANVQQRVEVKQKIIALHSLKDQYIELTSILTNELESLKLEEEISVKVQETIQKNQRHYYIQEQIRTLQNELGENPEEYINPELAAIKDLIDKSTMHDAARAKAMEEFERLKKTPSMSPEYTVNRNYIEWMTSLPWTEKSADNLNIGRVREILDEDHYNLEKPKERILEFIAILNLVGALRKQIICFVGPPGVGKTSLGRSIARALDRKFIRFSLGGVRDEAEIRGHRRTYIGSLPGRIIQSMKKAGTVNPLILLDEIDKMTMDFRGDPSSALLEALDPEQNSSYNDHYLEVDYDLSNVLFITTANNKYDIPLPLLDRMEIIELSSYLEHDKIEIAKRHLLPKALEELGLKNFKIDFKDESIMKIIREYTRESGVRNLEREMASVLRKLAKEIIQEYYANNADELRDEELKEKLKDNKKFQNSIKRKKFVIDENAIEKYLKAPKFHNKKNQLDDKVGIALGLAWTSVGGDTMPIEVSIMPGSEKLTLTGKLGDVMKESAVAALTFVRTNWKKLSAPESFYKSKEIHIHVPEGAIPKDGPSAGITMTMALISAATNKPIRGDVAMTGEVTLRGNVLAIGGLNEKLLAAKRQGIIKVIIPSENERDLEEVSPVITENLEIILVKDIFEALPHVFRNDESVKMKARSVKISK